MQGDLKILDVYRNSDASKVDKFDASLKSSYSLSLTIIAEKSISFSFSLKHNCCLSSMMKKLLM